MTGLFAIHVRAGGDPRDFDEFVALRDELAHLSHPACPDVDWGRIEQLCLALFQKNGADLQSAAAFALANGQRYGLDGMVQGVSLFEAGSATLKPGSTKVLINALVDIKAQPDLLIVITGHSDATGNPEENIRLSQARAASVHDWMQRMGDIPASCFAVRGAAASQPIASNDTEAGREANRRVDIRLVPEKGACQSST